MKLSDLLVDLRKELTKAEDKKANVGIEPKYKIETINVEIYVENIVGGNGEVNITIAKLGMEGVKKDCHKINIELKPL
jgi:hypothetical protein